MPGEERKFKRLTIVAFIPSCRREREEADSHAEATGVSAAGVCVPVEVGAAVAVGSVGVVAIGEGRGVAVGSESLCVATAFVIADDAGGAVTAGGAKDVLDAGTVIGTVVIVDIAI
jgi:hypothetical protein